MLLSKQVITLAVHVLDQNEASINFMLNVTDDIAPTFSASLADLECTVLETLQYLLPDVTCSNTCTISIDLDSTSNFISYSNGLLTITPTSNDQAKAYSIAITLLDNSNQFTTIYSLSVEIIASSSIVVTVPSSSSSSSTASSKKASSSSSAKTTSSSSSEEKEEVSYTTESEF